MIITVLILGRLIKHVPDMKNSTNCPLQSQEPMPSPFYFAIVWTPGLLSKCTQPWPCFLCSSSSHMNTCNHMILFHKPNASFEGCLSGASGVYQLQTFPRSKFRNTSQSSQSSYLQKTSFSHSRHNFNLFHSFLKADPESDPQTFPCLDLLFFSHSL